jgi:predicted metal-dependent TIM-barrel fold hydrolase
VVAVIEPAFWAGSERTNVGSWEHYFHHITTFEPNRAAQFGIKHFSCIGINPKDGKEVSFIKEVIAAMKPFLSRSNVVAIGEIGLDEILPGEEEGLRLQLLLAEEMKMPVLIHTPHHNKKKGVERIAAIIKETKVTQERILMDHNNEETMDISMALNVVCGLTVYPTTKLSPQRAVNIMDKYGTERLSVNSAADWGISDPLMVPKVVAEMKKRKYSDEVIEQVVFHNPKNFFSQWPTFKI